MLLVWVAASCCRRAMMGMAGPGCMGRVDAWLFGKPPILVLPSRTADEIPVREVMHVGVGPCDRAAPVAICGLGKVTGLGEEVGSSGRRKRDEPPEERCECQPPRR